MTKSSAAATGAIEQPGGDTTEQKRLVELLSMAQNLVSTLERSVDRVDDWVVDELSGLASHIQEAKEEITELPACDVNRFPEAGQELDEVVRATEQATNTIMEQAEAILAADTTNIETYQAEVEAAVMQIFEACSFQDITGQRISKVVSTLTYIEERIGRINEALGIEATAVPAEEKTAEEKRREDLLLNGPQAEGEGIAQDEIDALFS